MTRLLISTAIAGLLALSSAAQAQGDDHRQDNGRAPEAGHAAPRAERPAPQPQAARPAPQAARQAAPGATDRRGVVGHMDQRPAQPAAQAQPQAPRQGRDNATRDNGRRGPDQGNAMRAPNTNAARGPAPSTAMRAQPGNRPGGRDFSAYHRNFSAPHPYRAQTSYRRPTGWYAHRWTFGEILPSLFWASDYWLNDYYDYGLMPPPPGTVWVRDGDDALLIDRYSGEIIQVEYSAFY